MEGFCDDEHDAGVWGKQSSRYIVRCKKNSQCAALCALSDLLGQRTDAPTNIALSVSWSDERQSC